MSYSILRTDLSRALFLAGSRCPLGFLHEISSYYCFSEFFALRLLSSWSPSLSSCFLQALASGRRHSDLYVFSGNPADLAFERDGSITINLAPEFLTISHAIPPLPH